MRKTSLRVKCAGRSYHSGLIEVLVLLSCELVGHEEKDPQRKLKLAAVSQNILSKCFIITNWHFFNIQNVYILLVTICFQWCTGTNVYNHIPTIERGMTEPLLWVQINL